MTSLNVQVDLYPTTPCRSCGGRHAYEPMQQIYVQYQSALLRLTRIEVAISFPDDIEGRLGPS